MTTTSTGLCGSCAHQRVVGNTRGSTFSMCGLAKTDARYPKYPRLPVLECAGYAAREPTRTSASECRLKASDDDL